VNLAAMRTLLGNPSTTDVADTELLDRLNEANKEITAKYKLHKGRKLVTFPTVISQESYSLPDDCFAVLRLRDNTNNVRIRPYRSDDEWARRDTTTPIGMPTKYIRHRAYVSFFPVPDGVYTIELFYSVTAPDLADDSDSPVIAEPWHIGIVRLARSFYFDMIGDYPKWTAALASYNRWLESMPTEMDEEMEFKDVGVELPSLSQDGTGPQLPVDWDHSDDDYGSIGGYG
jgi:hypothetical protein